jgi:hypothetical protein
MGKQITKTDRLNPSHSVIVIVITTTTGLTLQGRCSTPWPLSPPRQLAVGSWAAINHRPQRRAMVTVLGPLGGQQSAATQSVVPITMPKSRVVSRCTRPLSFIQFLPAWLRRSNARWTNSRSAISLTNVAQSACDFSLLEDGYNDMSDSFFIGNRLPGRHRAPRLSPAHTQGVDEHFTTLLLVLKACFQPGVFPCLNLCGSAALRHFPGLPLLFRSLSCQSTSYTNCRHTVIYVQQHPPLPTNCP